MIITFSSDKKFFKAVQQEAGHIFPDLEHKNISHYTTDKLKYLYEDSVQGIIFEKGFFPIPFQAWYDLLSLASRRIPVIVLSKDAPQVHNLNFHLHPPQLTNIRWINNASPQQVAKLLYTLLESNNTQVIKTSINKIPQYDPHIPLQILSTHGALSLIVVHPLGFQNIAKEYGTDAYSRLQSCFQDILADMWGSPGCFRKSDFLCKRSEFSNDYFIFFQPSRAANAIPAPGMIERATNRITTRIQTALWHELTLIGQEKRLPDCLTSSPSVAVGYSTGIINPCVEKEEIVDQLLNKSYTIAKIQHKRILERQREFMQSLIKTQGALKAHYQAIFSLTNLTKEMVIESHESGSIFPLKDLLFGFESLIRLQRDCVPEAVMKVAPLFVGQQSLRPDVLFNLAHESEVSLELDQACLAAALENCRELPGRLMINILPRNLYQIEKILPGKLFDNIVFEMSESEEIANFELILKVKNKLKDQRIGIAADDFGRGFTGIERILKIQPDLIKLDRSLVQNIHIDASKQAFLSGIVNAVENTDALIIAEGIELWEEAEVVQRLGVHLVQGFLLHRPSTKEKIMADLNENKDVDSVTSNLNSVA